MIYSNTYRRVKARRPELKTDANCLAQILLARIEHDLGTKNFGRKLTEFGAPPTGATTAAQMCRGGGTICAQSVLHNLFDDSDGLLRCLVGIGGPTIAVQSVLHEELVAGFGAGLVWHDRYTD